MTSRNEVQNTEMGTPMSPNFHTLSSQYISFGAHRTQIWGHFYPNWTIILQIWGQSGYFGRKMTHFGTILAKYGGIWGKLDGKQPKIPVKSLL